jgi:hypothetical protein
VFLQFLDGVGQLARLFPGAFEFTARLPLAVAHHLHSCRFGTFLLNSERERAQAGLAFKTPSLWAHLAAHAPSLGLLNPSYDPRTAGDALLPHPSSVLRRIVLWDDWFLRYAPVPSHPGCARSEAYAPASYAHARVAASLHPSTLAAITARASASAAAAANAAAAVAAAQRAAAAAAASVLAASTAAAVAAAPATVVAAAAPAAVAVAAVPAAPVAAAAAAAGAAQAAAVVAAAPVAAALPPTAAAVVTAVAASVDEDGGIDAGAVPAAEPSMGGSDGAGGEEGEGGAMADASALGLSYFPQGGDAELPGDDEGTDTEGGD